MSRIETIRARLAEAGDGLYESDLAWAVRALDALVDAIESYVSATHYDTSPISRTAVWAKIEAATKPPDLVSCSRCGHANDDHQHTTGACFTCMCVGFEP